MSKSMPELVLQLAKAQWDVVDAAIEWEKEWWSDHPQPDPQMKKATRRKLEEAVTKYNAVCLKHDVVVPRPKGDSDK